jgi:hypothetical protein
MFIASLRLTRDVELRAFIEETQALRSRATAEEVAKSTGQEALSNIRGVSGIGDLVAARKLGIVTTLLRTLLDSHAVGNGELDVAVCMLSTTTSSCFGGKRASSDQGGEQGDGLQQLHCDGVERGTGVLWGSCGRRED